MRFDGGWSRFSLALLCACKVAPWYLIAKISDVMGGTGWHRSYLIDQFLGHFTQWCLIGTSYRARIGSKPDKS